MAALKLTAGGIDRRCVRERGDGDADRLGARARPLPRPGARARSSTCPFALPTIVAGLTLLALYGPGGPFGVDIAFTRTAVVLALLFVAPALRRREPCSRSHSSSTARWRRTAASSAPAGSRSSGGSFPQPAPRDPLRRRARVARAIGEFGSIVLISGNLPFDTEVSSVYIFGRIESGDPHGAQRRSPSCC